MQYPFLDRLHAGETLVADGATGTNYQARGLAPGVPPEHWVFEQPDEVLGLHRAFADAGADLLLTCTFGGNALRLHASPYAGRAAELNRTAAALARQAAATAGRPVLVAGSMGPTGQLLAPLGPLERTAVVAAYAAQAAALAEGGVDVLVLETFFALDEAEAAIEGVRSATDLPLVCSFSYDRGLRTMMGVRPAQMARAVAPLGVAALGANCGTTLDHMEQIVRELAEHAGGVPIWAKPNAGQPTAPAQPYPIPPAEMAAYARRFVAAGARIVGGCCGTTPAHLAAVAAAVRG